MALAAARWLYWSCLMVLVHVCLSNLVQFAAGLTLRYNSEARLYLIQLYSRPTWRCAQVMLGSCGCYCCYSPSFVRLVSSLDEFPFSLMPLTDDVVSVYTLLMKLGYPKLCPGLVACLRWLTGLDRQHLAAYWRSSCEVFDPFRLLRR